MLVALFKAGQRSGVKINTNFHHTPRSMSNQPLSTNSSGTLTDTPVSHKRRGHPQACLFAAAISPQATEQELRELFSQAGPILSITIVNDRNSNNNNYAFIQYQVLSYVFIFSIFLSLCIFNS